MVSSRGPFEPRFSELPSTVPIFPLSGAVLLPGGSLPLNIFEPRYLSMVRDAIASPHRLIGMIQSYDDADEQGRAGELYDIGCAGRISSFSESDDGRVMITLSGTTRFRRLEDHEVEDGYRLARVSWADFEADLAPVAGTIQRDHLVSVLHDYFKIKGFTADWDQLDDCEDERLVTTLSMICPLDVPEKQALLEANSLPDRTQLLITILEMASHSDSDETGARH